MFKKKNRRLVGICSLLLSFLINVQAQYTVRGGEGTPLLVNDDTSNRIQVYLLYGLTNAQISYTSSSTSHQWYRYKTRALEPERIESVQSGTTSTIQRVEEGYGYFVEESGSLARYVWITDYSKYQPEIANFRVVEGDDPCRGIQLGGDGVLRTMNYITPSGVSVEIPYQFKVAYDNLSWDADKKYFNAIPTEKMIEGDPFKPFLDPPLCDTDFELTDLLSEHFGLKNVYQTEVYQAVALEVYSEIEVTSPTGSNVYPEEGESSFSAPAEVHFTAYANSPVASLYTWKIYPQENPDQIIVNFTGDEVDYTFYEAGMFIAQLEVTDRTGKCTEVDEPITIQIRESALDVPNIFTPGTSPGINDEFKVVYKSLVSFKGWIFNRWGAEMFHWTDPEQGWNGKKGGKYVPPGVYYYVIEAKGSDGIKYKKTGHVNILRPKNVQE